MKLLILGIGNPVPSFIHRRLVALKNAGLELTIALEYGQKIHGISGVQTVYVGGKPTRWQQFLALTKLLAIPHIFLRLMSFRTDLKFEQRLKWAVVYFPLTRVMVPDIVHIQWLAALPEYEWLRHYFKCPFIGSARGSQVTVYPVTRPGHQARIEYAIQQADYIHCVSADMLCACERLGARADKLFVNYNGIDLQRFKGPEEVKLRRKFTMISIGSLMWRKGLYYQLQILKQLCDDDRDVELCWIGEGVDREGLLYTAHVLGIADRVNFVGRVESDQLAGWLATADLYLSTSVAEGLANSVVEAIACGLPVLAFACEGMEEVVLEGTNGFILPVGDVQGMARKITYLIDNTSDRIQMGHSSRQHAVENFDENKWVTLMLEKYKSIATNFSSGR